MKLELDYRRGLNVCMSSRSRCGQSRSRQSHETKTPYRDGLVEAAVALRTACGRFTDQSQTRAAHAWTLACAAMRCLVSSLSLQWPQSVRPRLSLDQQMRALPTGALIRLKAKLLYILSTRRFGNNGGARTSNSMHADGRINAQMSTARM